MERFGRLPRVDEFERITNVFGDEEDLLVAFEDADVGVEFEVVEVE